MGAPASSARSERHFSVLNRLLPADCKCLENCGLADLTFLEFVFTDFTFHNFVRIVLDDVKF